MDVFEHIAFLEQDGPRLAAAAVAAGWDAPVPGTEWTARELVIHVGGVHRWAADIVGTGAATAATAAGAAVGEGPSDDELAQWFLTGHEALVDALRSAPADLSCFTFLPAPSPLAFWARRQAHETAVHRADAEGAVGTAAAFEVGFAQDGIAEMLDGFARRRANAVSTPATLALRPTDGGSPWLITFGGERIEGVRVDGLDGSPSGTASAAVSAPSGDLYLWLWNRPAAVTVSGDASVAALWRSVRVRWS